MLDPATLPRISTELPLPARASPPATSGPHPPDAPFFRQIAALPIHAAPRPTGSPDVVDGDESEARPVCRALQVLSGIGHRRLTGRAQKLDDGTAHLWIHAGRDPLRHPPGHPEPRRHREPLLKVASQISSTEAT